MNCISGGQEKRTQSPALYYFKNEKVIVLTTKDGELISRILHREGELIYGAPNNIMVQVLVPCETVVKYDNEFVIDKERKVIAAGKRIRNEEFVCSIGGGFGRKVGGEVVGRNDWFLTEYGSSEAIDFKCYYGEGGNVYNCGEAEVKDIKEVLNIPSFQEARKKASKEISAYLGRHIEEILELDDSVKWNYKYSDMSKWHILSERIPEWMKFIEK